MNTPLARQAGTPSSLDWLWASVLCAPMLVGYLVSGGEWDGLLRALAWLMLVAALALPRSRWQTRIGHAALLYGLWSAAMIIRTNFLVPHEWDFLAIYLDSKTAAMGLNPFRPENYLPALAAMDAPIQPSAIFGEEILAVGMLYFPSSLLAFAPLGVLPYGPAHLLWVALNLSALGYAVWVLYRAFSQPPESGTQLTFWFLLGLVLLWPATKPSVHFQNSHFLCFLLVVLLWRDRHLARGAVWIVLGTLLKPFFVLLLGYYFFRRQWRVLLLSILAIAGTWLLSIPIWGMDPILDYLFNNPNARVPTFKYTSNINHSLLSVLVRAGEFDFSQGYAPTRMPLFLALGGSVSLLTAVLCWLTHRKEAAWTLAAVLCLAVLMYPGSLKPYSLFLLPVFLLHWRSMPGVNSPQWMVISGVFMTLMIRYAFWTNLWLWGICLLVLGYQYWQRRRERTTSLPRPS